MVDGGVEFYLHVGLWFTAEEVNLMDLVEDDG